MLFQTSRCLVIALWAAVSCPQGAAAAQASPSKAAPSRPLNMDLRLEVARQWEAKGEYDKAVQELRLYLSEHTENAGAI
jgi:hypothetical protein